MLQGMNQAVHVTGDLRRRLLFTLLMFLIFRLGVWIPVPGVDAATLQTALQTSQVSLFGLLNLFSGGAFFTFSIFAMSIFPYINASIIMQLLTTVIPSLEELSKEGQEGQKKITQYTRYLTVALALIQSFGTTITLSRLAGVVKTPGLGTIVIIALTLTVGSVLLMWIGELITEYGIGNGISLIIVAGIVAQLPGGVGTLFSYLQAGTVSIFSVLFLVVVGAAVIAGVVAFTEAERRIPVQYAKRMVGRKMYQGTTTHLPIKMNPAGVIPVIFAIALLILPQTLSSYWNNAVLHTIVAAIAFGQPLNLVLQFCLVVAFTFFYTFIVFKPDDVADNLKKYGGFIPGIRPGKPTAEYLTRVASRLVVMGALFLGVIAIMPTLMVGLTNIPNIYFGGTALLIVVMVTVETIKQIQAQLIMRNYQGFLR